MCPEKRVRITFGAGCSKAAPVIDALYIKGKIVLVWDETDVLAVLEVLPEVEHDGIWHKYVVEKDGIQLKITIYQYDGDVRFELINLNNNRGLFVMQLFDCQGIHRTFENDSEHLDFAPSKCFGSRYDGEQSIPFGIRVRVNPSINVSVYG